LKELMEVEYINLKGRLGHDFPYKIKNRKCPHTSLISITNAGGCIFRCPMCYARAYTWSEPNKIKIYANLTDKLEEEIKSLKVAFPFYISQITDPLQPVKQVRECTVQVIRILLKYNLSFRVVTKSSEGIRYLISEIPQLIDYPYWFVEITIESTPEKQEVTSPYASKIKERIAALKYLTDLGIDAVARTDPTILGLITPDDLLWLIERLSKTGIRHIIASCGYYNKLSFGNLLKRMERSKFKDCIPKVIQYYGYEETPDQKKFMASLDTRKKFHRWFKEKVEAYGLTYAVCQELPREWDSENLPSCEGSYRNPVHIWHKGRFQPINCYGDCLRSCPNPAKPPCGNKVFLTQYPYQFKNIMHKGPSLFE